MLKEIKNDTLYFDGCSTVELARQYGTPLYVFSETEIVNRFAELRECFLDPWPGNRAAYACKAFCTPAMLALAHREGMCADVVSGGELYAAIQAGLPAGRIEFNGNNKTRAELEMAVDYGIGRVIIDSPQELPMLEAICEEKGRKMNVLYRVTPGVRADTHDFIVTGKKDSKFGIPLDDDVLYPAVKAAIDSEWVSFLGFHFHVGSQLLDNAPFLAAFDVLLNLTRETRARFGRAVAELNVGGGFGITYTTEARRPYAYYLDAIMNRLTAFCEREGIERPAVVTEPGRSIVGEAGITLYTVGSVKDIRGVRKYVSVDGGMTDNIRPALYGAAYRAVVASRASAPADDVATVCGKCCESGDILIKDARIASARPGDILAVFSTGAYGYSMASNYNSNPVPAVALVKNGHSELIVKRQSYADIFAGAVVPESLRG
jgi:diaminopimelate decarboxylase